jgi:hypothetical protein
MVLLLHARQAAVQVRLMSVCNERQFILEVDRLISPSVPKDCSGAPQQYHMAVAAHVQQPVEGSLMSVSNEVQYTRDVERVFRP